MAENSLISWTQHTWNPVVGCDLESPGCSECFAMRRVAPRLANNTATPQYHGTVRKTKTGYVWTGKIGIAGETVWNKPFTWKKPAEVFVNSTGDLFHPGVADEYRDHVLATAALTPHLTYQILTKRPHLMLEYLGSIWSGGERLEGFRAAMIEGTAQLIHERMTGEDSSLWNAVHFPIPNVRFGVSIEDPTRARERLPFMRKIAEEGWFTWVSYEPALFPVDWSGWEFIKWMVAGGESGKRARPDSHSWYRDTLKWCRDNNIPFHMKQLYRPGGRPLTALDDFPPDLQVRESPS